MFETIVALATPPFKSALAIIRVSGDDCFNIVSKCFSKDLTNITKRTSFVGYITNGAWVYEKPTQTYTDFYNAIAGHRYIISLGANVGSRFRSMFTTTDVRTVTSGRVTGTKIVDKNKEQVNISTENKILNKRSVKRITHIKKNNYNKFNLTKNLEGIIDHNINNIFGTSEFMELIEKKFFDEKIKNK